MPQTAVKAGKAAASTIEEKRRTVREKRRGF